MNMQNFVNSVKSKGVVVFAFNTHIDYVAVADQTCRLIEKNLGLPITLVTDHDAKPVFVYDQIVRVDPQGHTFRSEDATLQWRNFGRYLAYELSPYDETIVLDTDYLVLDDSLLKLFDTEWDYRLMHHNRDENGVSYELMGETSLPFVWATVVLFRKSPRAEMLFELVGKIQRNYEYYRLLYNIRERNYRNDYAFAIANTIMSGYHVNEQQGIPWRMFTVSSTIERIAATDTQIHVHLANKALVLPYQNIHVMDKAYLQTNNFRELVNELTI